MATTRNFYNVSEDETQLDISSLIDVCFLLLIYFMVAATLLPKEKDLRLALPSTDGSERQSAIPPIFIRIAENGAVFSGIGQGELPMDSDPTIRELPLLSDQLSLYRSAAISAGDDPIIQLLVDGDASQQRVIDVLNTFGEAGIVSVTFTDLLDQL